MSNHFQTHDEEVEEFQANQVAIHARYVANDNRQAVAGMLLNLWLGVCHSPASSESAKLLEYEIHEIEVTEWKDNKFTAVLTVSVRPAESGFRLWAKNGGERDGEWIRNKKLCFTIVKEKDSYQVQKVS